MYAGVKQKMGAMKAELTSLRQGNAALRDEREATKALRAERDAQAAAPWMPTTIAGLLASIVALQAPPGATPPHAIIVIITRTVSSRLLCIIILAVDLTGRSGWGEAPGRG